MNIKSNFNTYNGDFKNGHLGKKNYCRNLKKEFIESQPVGCLNIQIGQNNKEIAKNRKRKERTLS